MFILMRQRAGGIKLFGLMILVKCLELILGFVYTLDLACMVNVTIVPMLEGISVIDVFHSALGLLAVIWHITMSV